MSTRERLWGGETRKAVDNFPVSGERVPVAVVRWLGRIKGAAARANADLGLLDGDLAERIAAAADEIAQGSHDDQFPIDVFQTGSGTSSNMNANEVIATLAGEGAHPNDHVNMGQSSNDVFPSAVHLAALDEATNRLLPALERLEKAFADKAEAFKDIVKSGRTHLMDAVPVTLGQEFAGYAAQIRLGRRRVRTRSRRSRRSRSAAPPPAPASTPTATSPAKVRETLVADTGLEIRAPEDPFEAQGNRDALVELSGALKVIAVSLTKIANDLALMGSGPRAGHRRDLPARAPEGLLDHARQGQPGAARGRAPGQRAGDRQRHRDHRRRPAGPVRAQRADPADGAQPAPVDPPADHARARCSPRSASRGSRPNLAGCEASAEGTLAVATALNPFIGYDKAAEIVKDAAASGRTLREVAREHGVDEATLDEALDLRKIAAGSQA